jgi:hypothetical protein
MSLSGPIRRLLGKDVRLLKGQFRRERMHSKRRGMLWNMRICEPDIGMLAPCENCGPVEMNIFTRWGLDGGRRWHRASPISSRLRWRRLAGGYLSGC